MKKMKNWQLALANTRQDEDIRRVKERVTVLEKAANCLPLMEGVEICSKTKPGYRTHDLSTWKLSDVASEKGFKQNFCVSVQKQDVSTLLDMDPNTLPFTTATVCVDKSKANEHLEDLNFGFYHDNLKECSVAKIEELKERRDAANAPSDLRRIENTRAYKACETALPSSFFKEPKKIPTIVATQNVSGEIPPAYQVAGFTHGERSTPERPELRCKKVNEGYDVYCGTESSRLMTLTEPFEDAEECASKVRTEGQYELLRSLCAADENERRQLVAPLGGWAN